MSLKSSALRSDVLHEFPFSEAEFSYLAGLLRDSTGIVLNSSKMNMVYARLARRLRELNLKTFAAYCELLQSSTGDQEMGNLINALTTNLTKFFRESHHFDHLRNTVIPAVAARKGATPKRLRIWSAGCSSGEEPYSIAMVVADELARQSGWDAKILATDLDTNMVATGRTGLYSQQAIDELQPTLRDRYLTRQEGDVWAVQPQVRQYITFKQLNLLHPWPMSGPFDAIFCRNVMIYFDGPTKNQLIKRFVDMLAPGGWLYIGHSETLFDNKSKLELDGRTVYRKAMP